MKYLFVGGSRDGERHEVEDGEIVVPVAVFSKTPIKDYEEIDLSKPAIDIEKELYTAMHFAYWSHNDHCEYRVFVLCGKPDIWAFKHIFECFGKVTE